MTETQRSGNRNGVDEDAAAPEKLIKQGLGVPWLFAIVYSSVGFSIYFALGVVADRGLGLTPLIFLAAGLLFVMTALSYVEGGSMFRERGGSSTLGRHAFNEFVAFVAGWAILIDYLIVIALAAISVPHYMEPIFSGLSEPGWEVVIAGLVIAGACTLNILDLTGRGRQTLLAALALSDLALQVLVIVIGAIVVMDPSRLTDGIDLFTAPGGVDIVYAFVLAMLAYSGIEAASNLAPEIHLPAKDLKRVIGTAAVTVPVIYAGMAAIALMAVPVLDTPTGPHTELGGKFVENPVLGVVSAFDPHWLASSMRVIVALIATPVLIWSANTAMLGVSRHIYTLAINRQIPSWLGKLGKTNGTPHVAIVASGLIALGLVIPTDVRLLAGIYAFGAMLAITIAHLSIIKLRFSEPDKRRPFKVPLNIPLNRPTGTVMLPLPAVAAALISFLALLSVLAYHSGARYVGGGWMLFGVVAYVIYRKGFEGTSLTKRVTVSAQDLTKQAPDVEYARIVVPVFGGELDDDIVSTAGRLAESEAEDSDESSKMFIVYVIEVPLSIPLDAPAPKRKEEAARKALERAEEVGAEYENVKIKAKTVHARKIGAGIVEVARKTSAEAIVMGGEPPSKIRGGAVLGGIGAVRPDEIGAATEYVLRKAPCRVLLTAPADVDDAPEISDPDEPETMGTPVAPAT